MRRLPRRTRRLAALSAVLLSAATVGAAGLSAAAAPGLGAQPVFLVRSDTTTDASVAASAAARAGAPLLYTSPTGLDAATRTYLSSYGPTTVVLVGGPAALSPVIASSVEALGFTTVRAQGEDRAATAVALADLVDDLPAAGPSTGTTGTAGATGATGPAGPAGAPGATTVFRYLDRQLVVPQGATTPTLYRVDCPQGSHIINGAVLSGTGNAGFSTTQYPEETATASSWVISATYFIPSQTNDVPGGVPTGDAVAQVRILCASA